MDTKSQLNLFYENPHIVDFEATVTECSRDEKTGHYRIVLDRTAFFPEQGGQTADRGSLNCMPVQDVQIKDGIIYHIIKEQLSPGSPVKGLVDWEQRFDFMQQHSGEHIISGLVNSHYGYDNVGFHLSRSEVTLDFSGPLSLEQLREIEDEANAAVWRNLPVIISVPSPEALKQLAYRSKKELAGDVRIVEIPGVDACACCAPHVDATGQIGLIKITGVQSHRGGVRVNILCGSRAVADYTARQDSVSAISVLLSAKQEAVFDAVSRLKEESRLVRQRANELQESLLDLEIASLPPSSEVRNVTLFVGELDGIALRSAVNRLTETYDGCCAIFSGSSQGGYRFVLGSKTRDCREPGALLRERFSAKCGGSAPMIQGSVTAPEAALRECLSSL